MPPPETMYCAEQINVPPELPDILKQFTKAAIRTQPPDVLSWSAAYFTALSRGEPLPVKRRLEAGATGLTPGLLDVLYQQLKENEAVTSSLMQQKWKELGLPEDQFQEIMSAGNFPDELDFMKFFAVACSHLGGKNIIQAMRIVCQIITDDQDGAACRIPFDVFTELFQYLASLSRDVSKSQVDSVLEYLSDHVASQGGMVMPRNFLSPDCPSLS